MWFWLTIASADPAARIDELIATRGQRALPSVPDVPRAAYERAMNGEVVTGVSDVPGQKARVAWGVGVIGQPIERYWAAVNDDHNKAAYTKLEYVEILDGKACSPHRLAFQYLSVTMLTDRWWVVNQDHNTALAAATQQRIREMAWKSVDGGAKLTPSAKEWADKGMEIPFSEGSWTLVDLQDGRTLVEYYVWSDPGGNVPARVASSFAAGGISDTFAAMEALAKKGPTCL